MLYSFATFSILCDLRNKWVRGLQTSPWLCFQASQWHTFQRLTVTRHSKHYSDELHASKVMFIVLRISEHRFKQTFIWNKLNFRFEGYHSTIPKFFNSHSGGWSPNWVHSARRPITGLLYMPRVIVRMGNFVEWIMAGETAVLERKPAPAPLRPTRARTRSAEVGSQRLTAWAMARPALHQTSRLQRSKTVRWNSRSLLTCKVQLSLCLPNQALRHKGVWGSGCIDRAWGGAGYGGMASRFLSKWLKSIPFLLRTVTPSRDVFLVLLHVLISKKFFTAPLELNIIGSIIKYFTDDLSLCRHRTNLRKASFSYYYDW
jgi:hypothetical protein